MNERTGAPRSLGSMVLLCSVALGSSLALGCGPEALDPDAGAPDAEIAPDAATDAGPPPTCADPATRYVFPSPRFEGADGLVVPDSDLAGDAIRADGWEDELEGVAAWPRRPTLVVPLDRAATSVDPSRVHLAVSSGDGFRLDDAPFRVALVSPDTIVVTPLDPFDATATEVLVAFDVGVAGDARPLGVCEGDGVHPGYDAARADWPGEETGLVMRLSLARTQDALVATWDRLVASPAVTVLSSAAFAVADLPEPFAISTEARAHFADNALAGQLELPEHRPAGGGAIALDPDGGLAVVGVTRPGFVVALPSTGAAPHPVVLYQHGGGGSPQEVFRVGSQLAEAGFAFVAIDLPEHNMRAGAGGGGDLDFLDFDSPESTRENFRQTVADHLAVLTGLAAIDAAVAAELGVADALDSTRLFYMGLSLGGVSGSMTSAVARELRGSALFVGGGGYPELLSHGLFAIAASRTLRGREPRPSVMLAAVETIADGGDPLGYAQLAEDRSARPTPMLFFQAIDDPLISHEANDQWARAFGASLARPLHHEAAGMALVDLPTADTFRFSADGEAATRVLIHCPMAEVATAERHGRLIQTDYAQEMVARCFTTALTDGRCEVIDTGFAAR